MVSKEVLTAVFLLCLDSGLAWTESFNCKSRKTGLYADPLDCSKYYWCVVGRAYSLKCPEGLRFHEELLTCDWKRNTQCLNVHPPSSDSDAVTEPPASTTSTTISPTTKSMQQKPSCVGRAEGAVFSSPDDCSVYFRCVHGEPQEQHCSEDFFFNNRTGVCDWAIVVDCFDSKSDTSGTEWTTPKQNPPPKTSPASVPSAPSSGGGNIAIAPRRVCYYTNWSQYRPGNGRFLPENVDPFLCTHLVYAFAKLSGNHLKAFEWNDESTDWSKGMYERFNDLKKINPNLKTLLAVGGWNLASAPFTKMVATAENRQDFADYSVTFLKSNGFDGLDLDWEYPANRGSPPGDKELFTLLIRQLRETYDKDAAKNGGSPLLVTAAVAAGKSTIDTAYDIPEISQHLDYISLMSYDLHGSWETVTGHHSGLYAHSSESEPQSFLNTDWAARYWVSKGCPKDKLIIGIPTYARTFTLRSSSDSSLGAPVTGGGTAGTYTREKGFLAYYEVCNMMATADVQRRIEDQKVPYLVKGNQWVGYEDVDSVTEKARYAITNGYGGVMTWTLDLDDFAGKFCGHGKYPLWAAVNIECDK